MPLELDDEDILSLQGTTQVTGRAIHKLIRHYTKNTEVEVHLELGSKAALNTALDSIAASPEAAGKRYLIIMQVNALDKQFHQGNQSHYVGLVIDKPIAGGAGGQYKIQYIDPMSHEINPKMSERIRRHLPIGDDIEIEEYKGGLQQAVIAGDEAKYIEGNDHDCGPMLVYLMTKAAHDKVLPALPDVEDKTKASKDIGRRLRRKFRRDKDKELADSTDLSELNLADLRISAPAEDLAAVVTAKVVGVDKASQAIKDTDDWVLRDTEDPLSVIFRKSYNPDVVSRRLDSIARLITGDTICAAVAFDGEKILFANNSATQNPMSMRVFEFLSCIAKSNMTLADIASNTRLNAEMEAIATEAAIQMVESKRSRGSNRSALIKTYKLKLLRDIQKVAGSLAIDSAKRFPQALINAFLDNKKIEFVRGKTATLSDKRKPSSVHAEMAILDRVLGRDGIGISNREVVGGRKSFYIGLTMLCCLDCRHAVVAFNEANAEAATKKSRTGGITVADGSTLQAIGVRGQHLQEYPWVSPKFFEYRPDIEATYQAIKGRKQKPFTGEVLADTSDSNPEIDSVKSLKSATAPLPTAAASSKSGTGRGRGTPYLYPGTVRSMVSSAAHSVQTSALGHLSAPVLKHAKADTEIGKPSEQKDNKKRKR